MSARPEAITCIIPSRLAVGESFDAKIKVLGKARAVRWDCFSWNRNGRYAGPFNHNARDYSYADDILPEWRGVLSVGREPGLEGPAEILFDGSRQGAFPGDPRPIRVVSGFRWMTPGFHFLHLRDPRSGVEALSSPVYVSPEPPCERLYWGDPHWQTFFSDGLRCPEELYAFARDEAFLDFGALSDHVEAITDRQWDYMVAVTNDYNESGRFVTLVGQEWTNSNIGHRNVYFRGDRGPVLRANDPRYDTLDGLWAGLAGLEALAIPHHSANRVMGVDWSLGWNPQYEKAVEIYSVWGSSECSREEGNLYPIVLGQGEKKGQHVLDALRRGYRFGFVGGGDVHDGRPGGGPPMCLHPVEKECHPKGLTAVWAPSLTREAVYDAMAGRRTYAASNRRSYLDVTTGPAARGKDSLDVKAASEHGLLEAVVLRNGVEEFRMEPVQDPRVVERVVELEPLGPSDFRYVRIRTGANDLAWSSPVWGSDPQARLHVRGG